MGSILCTREGVLMIENIFIVIILIYMLLMWCIDDVLLFFVIDFSLIIIFFNQSEFFTIPASMTTNIDILLASMILISFAKHALIANKTRQKYKKITGDE